MHIDVNKGFDGYFYKYILKALIVSYLNGKRVHLLVKVCIYMVKVYIYNYMVKVHLLLA